MPCTSSPSPCRGFLAVSLPPSSSPPCHPRHRVILAVSASSSPRLLCPHCLPAAAVVLTVAHPEKLMPEMANVAEYMLYSTKDKNKNVALEACKFWLTFAEDADLAVHLHPLLAKVAPVLLGCVVYGEDDLLWLEGDTEDAAVPDKDADIKPRH
ncbi:hypothetical protein B0H15DRAFT_956976 [Mycena belliarum]|uniref:Uncharacterized protein n=1 Tax=Mycena belliarum TaxID=1033014 RepID=A0AAD6TQV2_9AGAR|nr:hypothetical protein B0H15DRAFT_956976 [Mycena belliae]